MAEVRKSFAFDVDDKVKVSATGRDGWVVGLMIDRAKARLYSVETTSAEGRPEHLWAKDGDIEAVASEDAPEA